MWRNRGLVLLAIINFICELSTEQVIYTDGWIPMLHSDIYNQIKRGITEYPADVTFKPPIDNDYNFNSILSANSKKIRDYEEHFDKLNEKPHVTDDEDLVDKTNKYIQSTVNTNNNIRKAKKAWNPALHIDIDNNLALPQNDSRDSVTKEENDLKVITKAQSRNTYEVNEDIDSTVDNNTTEYIGYQYNPPTNETQVLTSKFYEILSKYNINSDDKLQNYDLSLKHKVLNPTQANRVPLPYRLNSLNHLPVDPLLAVFLSNYGFYIPSLYGIKANYNNLYGYLASNNIHNNKPFGLYKIFSDTDSWN